jgi:hypothetical protein
MDRRTFLAGTGAVLLAGGGDAAYCFGGNSLDRASEVLLDFLKGHAP